MGGHSLDDLYTFGLQEYYRESMCLINHAIIGQMTPYCRCGSRTSFTKCWQRMPLVPPTSADMRRIATITKKDRELYRQARILFIKRVRELEQKSGMQIFCPRKPGSAEIVWNSPGDRIRSIEMPEHLRHKDELVVFLDHGGFTWHEDVFYSVADLAYRMLGKPRNLLFLIDEFFAEYNNGGFEDFLAKYSTMGSIPNFRYKLVKIAAVTERPTYSMCSDFDAIKQKHGYDYRFAVTASLDDPDFRTDEEEWKGCMKKYKNSETDFFILHNVRAGSIEQNLIKEDWDNYIVVSNINEHALLKMYEADLVPVEKQYLHDGSADSVVQTFQKAVDDFQRWCRDPSRPPWYVLLF